MVAIVDRLDKMDMVDILDKVDIVVFVDMVKLIMWSWNMWDPVLLYMVYMVDIEVKNMED